MSHYSLFILDYEDLAKLVLEHGANVNVVDNYEDSPLHDAASKGEFWYQ